MDTFETRGAAEAPGRRIGSGRKAERGVTSGGDPERHPTIDNVNALLAERLSTTEHICRRIAAMTGAPAALVAAIVLQFVWIGIGLATNWDPYPFVFLLTCSNVIQLILIFVIAVAHVWAKTNAGMGNLYHSQHELLPLFKGGPPRTSTTSNWANARWRSNVWTYPGASSLRSDDPGGLKTIRPSSPPLCSRTPSSTSAIAATSSSIHSSARAQLSSPPMRPAASVELDPLYIDVIIRRSETATGNPAVLIGTGEAFELLAARRSSQTAPV